MRVQFGALVLFFKSAAKVLRVQIHHISGFVFWFGASMFVGLCGLFGFCDDMLIFGGGNGVLDSV